MFAFIWAQAQNGVIGNAGTMPWHLKDDLQYFKKTTLNHPIIMGRKTFESFGAKPLPKRENIVLTRRPETLPSQTNLTVYPNTEPILQSAQANPTETFFVIGGAQIFRLFLPYVERLYVTKIQTDVSGDTFMPSIPWTEFQLLKETPGAANTKFPHVFKIYQRQK